MKNQHFYDDTYYTEVEKKHKNQTQPQLSSNEPNKSVEYI